MTRTLRRLLPALATIVALGGALPAMAQAGSAMPQKAGKDAATESAAPMGGSGDMHQRMMSGMKQMQSAKMTGDVDKDFAMMMRMHHQQAIEMAKVEVARGRSSEMKAMAQKIMDDQAKEIAEFDAWLAKTK